MATTVRCIDPTTDPRWDALVHESASGGLFHSSQWLRAVGATYDFPPVALVVEDDGRLLAGIPVTVVDDALGRRARCGAFSDYCDPLVVDVDAGDRLLTALAAFDCPLRLRTVFTAPPAAEHAPPTIAWHGVDLHREEPAAWDALHGTSRRNIRRARSTGIRVEADPSLPALRAFYELHCARRARKYRLLPQPWRFFEALHAGFADDALVSLLAYDGDEVLGGILLLRFDDVLYYKFNASVDSPARPNDLLVWTALGLGRSLGCRQLDFGVSDLDQPGLVRFKEKFATERRDVTTTWFGPPPPAVGGDASLRRALGELTGVLTADDCSPGVASRAGDILYRYFV